MSVRPSVYEDDTMLCSVNVMFVFNIFISFLKADVYGMVLKYHNLSLHVPLYTR